MDDLGFDVDEGRTRLRKASGSCQETLIRRCPNGGTHPASKGRILTTEIIGSVGKSLGTEITHYQEEKKSTEIPSVATSEIGKVQIQTLCVWRL